MARTADLLRRFLRRCAHGARAVAARLRRCAPPTRSGVPAAPPSRGGADADRRGRRGERAAVALLRREGYRILATRLRPASPRAGGVGEIDVLAVDGETLVLVEVKPCETATARFAIRTALGQLLDYRQSASGAPRLLNEPQHGALQAVRCH